MLKRIVVDWGTSNFRAYRFDASGGLSETHQAAAGILTVAPGGFETVLEREIGGWLDGQAEVFLSGMITSRNGWVETPYVELPATLVALAGGAVHRRTARGTALHFLPGVAARAPLPDVMRGEEIQIFGAVGADDSATLILPGTHSKWARVEAGRLVAYRTFMTGEMFAVLKGHSILGRLMPADATPFDASAFAAGVRQAGAETSAGLLNDVFTTRSGALLSAFPPTEIADRLSGLLIGHEILGGLKLGWPCDPIILVGEEALCSRYAAALSVLGLASRMGPKHATVDGFTRLGALGRGA